MHARGFGAAGSQALMATWNPDGSTGQRLFSKIAGFLSVFIDSKSDPPPGPLQWSFQVKTITYLLKGGF
jgi:hypothetical protein